MDKDKDEDKDKERRERVNKVAMGGRTGGT